MPTLIAQTGPLAGQRIDVERELTIGRVDGDLVIQDTKLSRRHAMFRVIDGGLEAEDLGSTNGTFVDDRRIEGPIRLNDGAQVRLGSSRFSVEIPVAAIEATQIDRTVVDREALSASDVTEISHSATPADPDATSVAPARSTDDRTVLGARSQPPAPPEVAPAPPAAPRGPIPPPRPSPAAPQAPAGQLAAFSPPSVRKGGLATRSWVPVAASYGSAIAVAIALIIYFVTR